MDEVDISKIRRFSLFISIMLLIYASTDMHLQKNELKILNNIFYFDKQWLIPFILFFLTIYGILRFFYYGVISNTHPVEARKILKADKVPVEGWDDISIDGGGAQKTEFDMKRRQIYNQQLAKFFPGITIREGRNWKEQINFYVRFKCFIHDLDYYAPIWVGVISVSIYIICNLG